MSPFRITACLLATFTAGPVALNLAPAQVPKDKDTPEKAGKPVKEPPAHTAFPDLKPPADPRLTSDLKGSKLEAAIKKCDEERHALVFKHLVREAPTNATALQIAQFEQVREGLAYLTQVQETINRGHWSDPYGRSKDYLTMSANVFKLAADLDPTPANKVRCYEARVILMKDFERFIEWRVENGFEPPHTRNLARFYRLQAEADLLKLMEAAKDKK